MNFCAKLKICASIAPPSQSPKTLAVILQNRTKKKIYNKNEPIRDKINIKMIYKAIYSNFKNSTKKFVRMKCLLLFFLFPLLTYSQDKINYITLGFASECCGPPDGKIIFDYIKEFKQKYNVEQFEGYFFGPLGPEGEHLFLMNVKKLSDSNKIELVENIKTIIKNHKEEWGNLIDISTYENYKLERMKRFAKGKYKKRVF